ARQVEAAGFHVLAAAVSPDGDLLAAACGDLSRGDLRVWDLATGRLLRTGQRAGEPGDGERVAFSPGGKTLAYTDREGVRLQEAATGTPRATLRGALDFCFDRDGGRVAAWDDSRLAVYETATGRELRAHALPDGASGVVTFHHDSGLVA